MKTFLNYLLENYADEIHKVIDFTKEPKSKQSKFDFMFSMDQVEERLEYALQTTYGMKVIYEFECYLNPSIEIKPAEVCNLHDIKKNDDYNITYEEYTEIIEKYYDNAYAKINTLIDKSGLEYEEWFNTFDTLYDLVTTCKLYLNDDFYTIENGIIYEILEYDSSSFDSKMYSVGNDIEVKFNTNKVVIKDGKVDNKKSDTWYIEKDGSLNNEYRNKLSVEIVTPHIPLTEYLTSFNKMHSLLDNYDVITDESTGFHVNLVLKKPIDFIKLIIMTHDTEILTAVNRRTSGWCKSQYKILKDKAMDYVSSVKYDKKDVIDFGYMVCNEPTLEFYFPKQLNEFLYSSLDKEVTRLGLSDLPDLIKYRAKTDDIHSIWRFLNKYDFFGFNDDDTRKIILNPDYVFISDIDQSISSFNIILKTDVRDTSAITIYDYIRMMNKIFINHNLSFMDKYRSINFLKYKSGQMIEFRILGNDYLGQYKEKTIDYIKYFIFMMVVASNEDLYKEEYHEKIREMLR